MAIVYNPSKKNWNTWSSVSRRTWLDCLLQVWRLWSLTITLLNEKTIEYFLINFSMPATLQIEKTLQREKYVSDPEVYKEILHEKQQHRRKRSYSY
jgi:hypothetical protein